MPKEYITVGKASNHNKYRSNVQVMITEGNPLFEKIKRYGNTFGMVAYLSDYDDQAKELIFNLTPMTSQGVKNAMPTKRAGTHTTSLYYLGYVFKPNVALRKVFAVSKRIPSDNCYFEAGVLHIPIEIKTTSQSGKHEENTGKEATEAVAEEIAKHFELYVRDFALKFEDSIVSTITSEKFINKLANQILLKQAPQLTTKLNRIQEQNSASNKQLKEELSKEFTSAVKQLIDYWNK